MLEEIFDVIHIFVTVNLSRKFIRKTESQPSSTLPPPHSLFATIFERMGVSVPRIARRLEWVGRRSLTDSHQMLNTSSRLMFASGLQFLMD